jgi:hypothetical protein
MQTINTIIEKAKVKTNAFSPSDRVSKKGKIGLNKVFSMSFVEKLRQE